MESERNTANLDIVNVSEAAGIINVSGETVRRLDRAGKLRPVHYTAAGYRFYRRADVELLGNQRARLLSLRRNRGIR